MFQTISTVASLTSILALLALALPAQGKQDSEQKTFTCPMHPHIILPAKGGCPICGMDLIPRVQGPKKVKIPEGGLRDYCETYLEKALQEMQTYSYGILRAYVSLKGKSSVKKLRHLLESDVRRWRDAATLLGEMKDLESVALLEKMLADPRLAISVTWHCAKHGEAQRTPEDTCKKCGTPLRPMVANEFERLAIAGALHEMGQASGLQALEKIATQWYGSFAYNAMAQRDSPKVRKILAEATKTDKGLTGRDKAITKAHRFYAVCAQLRLGIEDHFPEAISWLGAAERYRRFSLIHCLGESGLEIAKKPLLEVMRDATLTWETRVAAAGAVMELGELSFQGFLFGAFEKTTAGSMDRVGVYLAWAEVGDKRALPFLETAIESGEGRSHAVMAAARILGRMAKQAKKK